MQYYRTNSRANNGTFVAPAVTQFLGNLRDSFKEVDKEALSLHRLKRLKQGNRTVEEHNTEFKLLVGRSGITEPQTLIPLYRRSISSKIVERIISHDPVPATLQGWMEKAVNLDKNWRIAMGILDKPRYGHSKK